MPTERVFRTFSKELIKQHHLKSQKIFKLQEKQLRAHDLLPGITRKFVFPPNLVEIQPMLPKYFQPDEQIYAYCTLRAPRVPSFFYRNISNTIKKTWFEQTTLL